MSLSSGETSDPALSVSDGLKDNGFDRTCCKDNATVMTGGWEAKTGATHYEREIAKPFDTFHYLTELPHELLIMVLDQCSFDQWKRLRCTNSFFAALLASRLFERIRLRHPKGRLEPYQILSGPVAQSIREINANIHGAEFTGISLVGNDPESSAAVKMMAKGMVNIKDISLRIRQYGKRHSSADLNSPIIAGVNQFLSIATGLEHLSLVLDRCPGAFARCVANLHLPRLSTVKLGFFEATQTQLTTFLRSIAQTLNEVELAYLQLSSGKWLPIFSLLGVECHLERFRFTAGYPRQTSTSLHNKRFEDIKRTFDVTAKMRDSSHNHYQALHSKYYFFSSYTIEWSTAGSHQAISTDDEM